MPESTIASSRRLRNWLQINKIKIYFLWLLLLKVLRIKLCSRHSVTGAGTGYHSLINRLNYVAFLSNFQIIFWRSSTLNLTRSLFILNFLSSLSTLQIFTMFTLHSALTIHSFTPQSLHIHSLISSLFTLYPLTIISPIFPSSLFSSLLLFPIYHSTLHSLFLTLPFSLFRLT